MVTGDWGFHRGTIIELSCGDVRRKTYVFFQTWLENPISEAEGEYQRVSIGVSMGIPHSWMVWFVENPKQKWDDNIRGSPMTQETTK